MTFLRFDVFFQIPIHIWYLFKTFCKAFLRLVRSNLLDSGCLQYHPQVIKTKIRKLIILVTTTSYFFLEIGKANVYRFFEVCATRESQKRNLGILVFERLQFLRILISYATPHHCTCTKSDKM